MSSYPKHVAGEDGWSKWVKPVQGFRFACCDCCLVHEMEFGRTSKRETIFRVRRHKRATAAMRAAQHVRVTTTPVTVDARKEGNDA